MKVKFLNLLAVLLIIVGFAGCTENQRAKQFGGTSTVNLPSGKKLESATWKEDHLWYLVRPMRTNEVAETHELMESSSFGIIEGKVIFKESK